MMSLDSITTVIPIENKYIPEEFYTSNNMIRKPGSFNYAEGEALMIQGVVTDIDDIPVDGVRVYIWHKNNNGVYNFVHTRENKLTDKEKAMFPGKYSDLFDVDFAGSGTAITDNRGRYQFFTIFPGGENSHVNFFIYHPHYGAFTTKMFFKSHPSNSDNEVLKSLLRTKRETILADVYFLDIRDKSLGKRADFDIKLNVIQKFKRL
jgi:protocatechuate 3,4-dioxygenase, beta subunit